MTDCPALGPVAGATGGGQEAGRGEPGEPGAPGVWGRHGAQGMIAAVHRRDCWGEFDASI